MAVRAAVLVVTAAMAFAGCLGSSNNLSPEAGVGAVSDLLKPATEPLWVNPQTTPHPMFNFPTLSHPATGPNVPAWWAPIPAAAMPSHIAGMEVLAAAGDAVPAGAGMSVFGSIAVVPGYVDDTSIVDISDPSAPKVLSTIPEERHRNVDFIAYPTGRLVAIFSTGDGLPYWDITDPTKPVRLGELKPIAGTHKVNVVPGTPIVYNANSNGGGNFFLQPRIRPLATGITEIFDLTDPLNPVHVQDWANGYGCHHIYFWNSVEQGKFRAICAGIEVTQLWDTADPRNPVVIVDVPVHHGNPLLPSTSLSIESFSHFAVLNYAGDVLVWGDESGGGGIPPGCVANVATPARDVSTPIGALWFYDISDETNPLLQGWWSPMNHLGPGSCTAHHGRLVADPEGRDMLAMAFYHAGTVLLDFSDPVSPRMVDQFNDGTNTWEVQYYNGHLFTGDLSRGMDVLTFV